MKFTSEDLMKAMGLSVGDRIKYNDQIWTIEKSEECQGAWIGFTDGNRWFNIDSLINGNDYEILPRPKRVGDILCKDFECCDCPIGFLCEYKIPKYAENKEPTLYQMFEYYNVTDQEIHDLLKVRLDKEVE